MDNIFDLFLAGLIILSVLSNFFGLPGNLIMATGSLFYGLLNAFSQMTFTFIVTVLLVVIIFEGLEFLLLAFTFKKYTVSKWGLSGALIGGFIGGYSGFIISPVAGAIVGSVIGVFVSTSFIQFAKSSNIKESIRTGYGAFMGRTGGLSMKVIGSVTIASIVITRLI
ncbi:MAG: DUF456 family protein [Caldithrix sp.]|nr:DUF456 family protein [Caldithrix sp.]